MLSLFSFKGVGGGEEKEPHFLQPKTHVLIVREKLAFFMLELFKSNTVPTNCEIKAVLKNLGYWRSTSEDEKRSLL